MIIPAKEYGKILQVLPILCVDLVICFNSKFLLIKRDKEPAKGQYWFPGGRVHKRELIAQAALRKASEETNLDCTFDRIISVEETIFEKSRTMLTDVHTVNICCLLKVHDISGLKLDRLHDGFIWSDKIIPDLHEAVKHPLVLLGYQ